MIIEEIKATLLFHDDTLDTAAYQSFPKHMATFSCPYIKQENSRPIYTQLNWEEGNGEDTLIAKGKLRALPMLRDQ